MVQDNECGAWGYDPTDINEDCVVNLADAAHMTAQWLLCTEPYEDNCIKTWEFEGGDGGSAKAYSPLAGTNHILQVDPNVMTVYEEGETEGDFTVALTSQPGSGTTVNVAIDPSAEGPGLNDDFVLIGAIEGDPNVYLTFDSTNWYVPQTVCFKAIDDLIPEPPGYFETHNILVSSICAEDPNFNDIAVSVTVQVRDNDQADILFTITPAGANNPKTPITGPVQIWEEPGKWDVQWRKIGVLLQVPPAGSRPVKLNAVVEGDVEGDNLPLTDPCLPYEATDDPNGMIFTADNYNISQNIKIWGNDDAVLQALDAAADGDEDYHATVVVTVIDDGGDTRYTGLEKEVEFDVEDNECGAWGYMRMDVAGGEPDGQGNPTPDCYVDIQDVAEMASRWLNCSDPQDPICQSYLE